MFYGLVVFESSDYRSNSQIKTLFMRKIQFSVIRKKCFQFKSAEPEKKGKKKKDRKEDLNIKQQRNNGDQ